MQNNQTQKTFNLREMCKLIADGTDPADIEWTCGRQCTWWALSGSDISHNPFEAQDTLFRLKQKMVTVNGFEIPAPMMEKPENGQAYFLANIIGEDLNDRIVWDGWTGEVRWFERGLCHSTEKNAIMHAKALLGIDPYKDEE